MKTETIVVEGVVRPDGTIEVPGKVGLNPGPVEVTLRQIVPTAPEDLLAFLARIWAA